MSCAAYRSFTRRLGGLTLLALLLLCLPPTLVRSQEPAVAAPAEVDPAGSVTSKRLGVHIRALADKEFAGRAGPASRLAGEYIADQFAAYGLRPAFGQGRSYYQTIPLSIIPRPARPKLKDDANEPEPIRPDDTPIGWNVAGVLPGSDPKLAHEWIIFGAHFDHLGVRGGQLHPGADDNASGVSAMLEAARLLSKLEPAPKRSILFIGFDLEEAGLLGSHHFVAQPPMPLEQLKLFVNADMIGRDAGGVIEPFVFIVGTERAPEVRETIHAARTEKELQLGWIGADLIGPRSDHFPFEQKQIPFAFFCTGEHPDYHSPSDIPERINHEKHARISRLIARLLLASANADTAPVWRDEPVVDLEEVSTACRVIDALLARNDVLKENTLQRFIAVNTRATLQGYIDRGKLSKGERTWLVNTCKSLLESL